MSRRERWTRCRETPTSTSVVVRGSSTEPSIRPEHGRPTRSRPAPPRRPSGTAPTVAVVVVAAMTVTTSSATADIRRCTPAVSTHVVAISTSCFYPVRPLYRQQLRICPVYIRHGGLDSSALVTAASCTGDRLEMSVESQMRLGFPERLPRRLLPARARTPNVIQWPTDWRSRHVFNRASLTPSRGIPSS